MTRILVLAGIFPPATLAGGPARSLGALATTVPPGISVSVLASAHDAGRPMAVPQNTWQDWRAVRVTYLDPRSPLVALRMVLRARRLRPDVYYLPSFFSPVFTILPLLLSSVGLMPRRPVLIAPRGEFSPGALALKRPKKAAYIAVFRGLVSPRRVVWHATSDLERDAIHNTMGRSATVLVRGGETELPRDPMPAPERSPDRLRMIFLGRIHPKKGLSTLLMALRAVPVAVDLDIYGPAEDQDYWRRCTRMIADLPENIEVRVHGPVPAADTVATFNAYDLFAFPTRGENFGHVIAESLAASCPVMATEHTPWTEVLQRGGGVVVDDAVAAWTDAIARYAQSGPDELRARRHAAGRAYRTWDEGRDRRHLFELALGYDALRREEVGVRDRLRRVVGRPAVWVRQRITDPARDRARRVRTSRWTTLDELGLADPERVRYVPSPWSTLRRVLPPAEVSPEDVFVDFGAGMGRMVLRAADYRFRRVIGVELSPDLVSIARTNVDRSLPDLPCRQVEIVNADVLDYEVPDDLTVAYFYNPFRGEVFETVVRKLIDSVDRSPRRVRIVYHDPEEEHALLRTGRVRVLRTSRGLRPTREWARAHSVRLYEITSSEGVLA